jgi:hypothetical protein
MVTRWEKARSTEEEFLRVAKETTDDVSERAKETLHETKEAVVQNEGRRGEVRSSEMKW